MTRDTEPIGWRRRYRRWMYRGGRPNLLARLLNRASAVLHSSRLSPGNWVTLEVTGRRTGRTISFPLVVVDHQDERRYLALAPGARAHLPVDRRAPLEEFARIADRYPVFRITPDPEDSDRTS
jgi:hypothetical protein